MTTTAFYSNMLNMDNTPCNRLVSVLCAAHIATAHPLDLLDTRREVSSAPCVECARIAKCEAIADDAAAKMRALLLTGKVSHTRVRYGMVCAYVRDDSSPTGVFHAQSCDPVRYARIERDLAGAVYGGTLAPLSPTEAR